MELTTAKLMQLLVVLIASSRNEAQVEAAVGLYGPDRYEGFSEICLLPMEFGYCRAKVQRYYFDIRRMKCTMFFWGGCAGNENNFKSLEECNHYCTSTYEDHVQYNHVDVKEKRPENRGSANAKYNVINSRDGSSSSSAHSTSKTVPKFSLKANVTSKETGYKGSFKASSKSFNVIPAPKAANVINNYNKPIDVEQNDDYDD